MQSKRKRVRTISDYLHSCLFLLPDNYSLTPVIEYLDK